MRRLMMIVALIALVAGSLRATVPAYGQDGGNPPPKVLGSTPAPYEEIAPETPILITFDQIMDKESVIVALSISPTVRPAVNWKDDKTLAVVAGDLQRGVQYTLKIAQTAKSAAGVALGVDYKLSFDVAGALKITQAIPAPDSREVGPGTAITVIFNRPVVPLVDTSSQDKLPQPLIFAPAVPGKGEWVSTSIYVFKPDTALAGGTNYTATIDPKLTDTTGGPLGTAYSWKFSTAAPQIISLQPNSGQVQIPLDTPIQMFFNQPMDRATTQAHFSVLGPNAAKVAGKFTWADGDRALTFTPDAKYALGTTYRVTITADALSASGGARLSNPLSVTFNTLPYPAFVNSNPANGQQDGYPGNGITLNYNTLMDDKSFAEKITVQPKPESVYVYAYGQNATVSFASAPLTEYTVTIAAGVKDIYGNEIRTPTVIKFRTRAVEPYLYVPTRGFINLTNAYLPDTAIYTSSIGVTQIEVRVTELNQVDFNRYAQDPYNFRTGAGGQVFTVNIESDPNKQTLTKLLLAGGKSGALKPGLYAIEVSGRETRVRNGNRPQQIGLVVGTANLTLKRDAKGATVWATDLRSGLPIPNAKVELYAGFGSLTGQGVTAADGTVRITAPGANQNNFTAFLRADNQFGVSDAYGGLNLYEFGVNQNTYLQPMVNTLYTDQPIYRPGRPVYFKGILRAQDDVTYTVPTGKVKLVINNPEGQNVYEKELTLTDFGTYSGQFDLPLGARLGVYGFRATFNGQEYGGGAFQVAEYRVPEFQVSATAATPEVVKGATVKVTVDSKFFFGGPVSNAKVVWNALGNPSFFNYTGVGDWAFGVNEPYWWYYRDFYGPNGRGNGGQSVGSGAGTTDVDGKFTIELPANWNGQNTASFSVEATVTDISNQPISGRTTVTVHPADLYVGLRTETPLAKVDKPVTVKLIAVDWASKALLGTPIKTSVILRRYEQDPKTLISKQVDDEIAAQAVVTNDKGETEITFTPKKAGLYRVYGRALDKGERQAESITYLWVSGPQPFENDQNDKALRLVSDKREYKPGDVAEILIPSPFAGRVQALVTVERAGVMKQEVITVEGGTPYRLPITDDYAPNVYLTVTLIKGMDSPTANPDYRAGVLELSVEVKQQLTVKLTPNVTRAQPGDMVRVDVLTTDKTGEPVAASVGIKMTDLANLSLASGDGVNLFDAFWYKRGLAVITGISLSTLIDTIRPEDAERRDKSVGQFAENGAVDALGGAANESAPTSGAQPPAAPVMRSAIGDAKESEQQSAAPRTNFVDTPLWNPEVITGADGRGTVEVKLPDNLTTWRLDGRGVSKATYAGQSTTDVISTKPLLVRPATPRFFVVGDEAELAAVVNNNTDADQTVQVRIDVKGASLIKDQATATVTIPKAGRARVAWQVKVGNVEAVDATFFATAGQFQDAAKPGVGIGDARLLPVYQYVAPDYVSTAGTLTSAGTRTELIQLPTGAATATSGDLTIRLNTSLAAVTLDGLDYLRAYPYDCAEQTVSKFLPNVITYRALQKLGQDTPALKQNLLTAISQALAKLKATQHTDGGWGWYYRDESNPLTTAYALLGLLEAKSSDLLTDQEMYTRALAFLLGQRRGVDMNTVIWDVHTLAFVEYVLARTGNPNRFTLDNLFVQKDRMNLFAKAYLAQAYGLTKDADQSRTTTLLNDLINAGVISATGLHFEEKQRDWWNWDSNTRTTAIVLGTLVKLQPQSELIPNIVRWLVVARKSEAWETTQETAWAVMALTDWMVVSNELKADYPYTVTLNGVELGKGVAGPENLKVTQSLQKQIADLLKDQANRVSVNRGQGAGSFYYTAWLHLEQPVEAIKPTTRGIGFSRQYLVGDKPVTEAKVGDMITVVLDINATRDLHYIVINDPIPAGTEMVDTSLQTTSQIGQAPDLSRVNPRYGWGWWWWSETQLKAEKAVLTARYLPAGTYRYVYQVLATAPGIYRVIPPNGNEFYFPEVFGRGSGSLFTIKPA